MNAVATVSYGHNAWTFYSLYAKPHHIETTPGLHFEKAALHTSHILCFTAGTGKDCPLGAIVEDGSNNLRFPYTAQYVC